MPLSPQAQTSPSPSPWPRWLGLSALALAAGLLLWWHALVLAPFVLSLALAYVLEPGVSALARRGVPRAAGTALCLLAAILLGMLLLLLLVPIVVDLAPMLREQLPEIAGRLWHGLVPWLEQMGVRVPQELSDLRPWVVKQFNTNGERWAGTLLSSLRMGGGVLLTMSGLAVLVPVLAFYWLADWPNLMGRARSLVPPLWRQPIDGFIAEADEVLGGYLRGQIMVMLILAVYYSVGLMLFGFNLALPIGVFTGLAVFIPYLGFGLGLILALFSGLLQFAADPGSASLWWPLVAVGVVYGLGQFIESFFLTPRLVGERIGLHPAGVIFVLMLFGQWLGFVGILMALPVSALLMVVLRRLMVLYRHSRLFRSEPSRDATEVLLEADPAKPGEQPLGERP
ncbi:AI-2E family transporter [Aquabacterium soli]|uniref:AI-2E family transporter n=1 Tax=Aquabacterium soli TaxID=2493092 RepID=A0A3R8S450_9BURK|nr:AI-2E family transporter [Aquabacterium soli]RRS05591.1 AI-2E family transporter [Aquabacterium soli]